MRIIVLGILVVVGLVQAHDRVGRHHRPHGAGRRRLITRVSYISDPLHHHHGVEGAHTVIRRNRRRRVRPVAVVPAHTIHPVAGFEGSYVAVAGTPGRGAVHVVEDVPALRGDSVIVVNGVRTRTHGRTHISAVPHPPPPLPRPHIHTISAPLPDPRHRILAPVPPLQPLLPTAPILTGGDRLPLPKCSYINTDFVGDDLVLEGQERDKPGVNAGSARACKSRCRLEDTCNFWTYREGSNRDLLTIDCFLKEGTPGLPVPREAVPRLGFVSGTQDNNCVCIKSEDEEDEVCPIKDPRGLVYPWRSLDEEKDDLNQGLLPLGWNRGVYGALDPRLGPIVGSLSPLAGADSVLEAQVRALRSQLDLLTRRLGQSGARLEEEPYEDFRKEEEKPDFSDI